jgi:hypothetical protein
MAAAAFAQGRIGPIQPELEAVDGNSGHHGAPDQARSAQLRRSIGA